MFSNSEKVIPIWLETIEAFVYDDMVNDYFEFLKKLASNGYKIEIHREGNNVSDTLQTIKDSEHMENFAKHYKKAIGVK